MNQNESEPDKPPSPKRILDLDLETPVKPSHDAVRVAHVEHFESEDVTQHQERTSKLLHKIDLHLLPFLILMYLLNFLDRSNLTQARQGTLEKDLGMKGTDFNLATSIFFVGYLLMQLPSNILLTRVRPGLYLSTAMTLWGVVSTCNAATHSFGGLIAVRFCLGFVEEGTITIGLAILSGFVLPNYPATTPWLTDEEKHFAAWRLIADVNEEDKLRDQSTTAGITMALRDYRLYLFIFIQHISLLSQTFQYFFPAIVDTLGYGSIDTLWLTAPVWARKHLHYICKIITNMNKTYRIVYVLTRAKQFATFLVSILVTWTSSKTKDRSIHVICLMLIAAVGNAIATGTTNIAARFFAMFLMPMGAVSAFVETDQIIVSWVANSFPRPLIKRSISIAIANMIGNTASIYGSYMYPKSASPRYIPGGTANTVICLLVALMALVLRFVHIKENRKLEILERELADGESGRGGDICRNHHEHTFKGLPILRDGFPSISTDIFCNTVLDRLDVTLCSMFQRRAHTKKSLRQCPIGLIRAKLQNFSVMGVVHCQLCSSMDYIEEAHLADVGHVFVPPAQIAPVWTIQIRHPLDVDSGSIAEKQIIVNSLLASRVRPFLVMDKAPHRYVVGGTVICPRKMDGDKNMVKHLVNSTLRLEYSENCMLPNLVDGLCSQTVYERVDQSFIRADTLGASLHVKGYQTPPWQGWPENVWE
ncbi:hypothetical protein VP1G_08724 [Cytospora mali]|uniref:Uncharacterized protein n=1 Tax=Cytospora mali TaxID=578113 RepID=A0A194VCD7_CYTMA|nr:hypothetical protein VP1G_08724 [Valsa mali var. pyri (nom. inval.)]